ncbi:MAG: D-glucuronyl C5-epimerase family protein [Thermoguttaceae bacterium]|nr:D-glucuronyl C5-epimerase family protein [Thermoguttaceae bacterium]MDW8038416.1 D-glucuronyl C5-epimerase family protein [Thermoguttaceae bacterium]
MFCFFLMLGLGFGGNILLRPTGEYGIEKTLKFLTLTGWAFLGAPLLIYDYCSLRRFGWALLAISTLMSLDSLWHWQGPGEIAFARAFGSNYIALGRITGLGLLTIVFFLLPTEQKRWRRMALVGISGLLLWAELTAGARGPILAMVLSVIGVVAVELLYSSFQKIDRFTLRVLLGTIGVCVLIGLLAQSFFPTFLFRMEVLISKIGESGLTRLLLYRESVRLWAEEPFWGLGPGGFALALAREDVRLYPHNLILELAVELGMVGVCIFLSLVAMAFRNGLECFRTASGSKRTVVRYLLVLAVFFFLNAMVSGDINDNRVLFTALALLGCSRQYGEKECREVGFHTGHNYRVVGFDPVSVSPKVKPLPMSLLPRTLLLLSLGGALVWGCQAQEIPSNSLPSYTLDLSPPQIYQTLLQATEKGMKILYKDNLTGRITWNQAQFLESLLNMYEWSHDTQYLDLFIRHADHILEVRDDRAGRRDWSGKSRPGWQIGEYYTLGIPVTIPDPEGNPSLEVQGIRRAGNQNTVVEVRQESENKFTLLVRNDFRRSQPIEVKFLHLTLQTVEKLVNSGASPDSWIRVRVVGQSNPRPGLYPLSKTYCMVLHELHTPIIGTPFLRFADLVFRSQKLRCYQAKAQEYVKAFEESFQDYAASWREDAEGGYFVFEPGGKFWASGLPVPYNGLSANGRFLLWLWRATGAECYLSKASALAKKVRAGIRFLPDGTISMPYWMDGKVPYTGWKRTGELLNGVYEEVKPDPATEDLSHFCLTLRFMVDAYRMGIVFQQEDLKAVARTFSKRLWKPQQVDASALCDPQRNRGFYLAHNLDGKGQANDYAIGSFVLLCAWDPSIGERALEVFARRYKDIHCIDVDYLYGELMWGWSLLARRECRWEISSGQKPIYPFTLRNRAEDYVRTSRLVRLDERGIPITDYGRLHGGAGLRYNPTFIANYALALYRDYVVQKEARFLQALEKQTQWFLDHRVERQWQGLKFWVWEFDFDNPTFGAKAPWVSALSQGRIACVFLAAYDLLGDPEYLRGAEYAFRAFLVPCSAGGVATLEQGGVWYEEVADEEAPSAKILNGHIAALQGLWTLWSWTGRQDVKQALDQGIAAVKRDLPLYDAGFLSYYSQWPTQPREYAPARDYNILHIHQLLWLYGITDDRVFLDYALRFARYDWPGWKITTAGSTNPTSHGPENLFFQMYSRYWSHNQFPTWILIDLGQKQVVEGVVLFGYTAKATPRDFQVSVSEDRQTWKTVFEKTGNQEQHFIEKFPSVSARWVKVLISKDNGNRNVALTGVAVLTQRTEPTAVSDWQSFSAANPPIEVFGQGWKMPERGWLIVDLGPQALHQLMLYFTDVRDSAVLACWESEDLVHWMPVGGGFASQIQGREITLPICTRRYVKIDFYRGCKDGKLVVRKVP